MTMGGYVKQSRTVPIKDPFPWSASVGSLSKSGTAFQSNSAGSKPTQVTTSYRASGTESESEDELLKAGSYRGRFRALRQEYTGSTLPFDNGHTFDSTSQSVVLSHRKVTLKSDGVGSPVATYVGPLVPDVRYVRGSSFQRYYDPTVPDLTWYSVQAVNRTKPLNPVASLSQALEELRREGLPALVGLETLRSKTVSGRNAGHEYLNWEFGYKPLANDISSAMLAVSQASSLLTQLQRDSGRWIRRRYTFPLVHDVSSEVIKSGAGYDAYNTINDHVNSTSIGGGWSHFVKGSTEVRDTLTTSHKIWFSGAYSYYLQSGDSLVDRLIRFEQKVNHLFGVELTPEVMWNLQPWSWLADWHWNIGQNIANATALSSDGLVMRYGYLMCESRSDHRVTVSRAQDSTGATLPPISVTYSTVRKQRLKATPYGFGSNPASFTGRQWSILGALGLTRAPTALR